MVKKIHAFISFYRANGMYEDLVTELSVAKHSAKIINEDKQPRNEYVDTNSRISNSRDFMRQRIGFKWKAWAFADIYLMHA